MKYKYKTNDVSRWFTSTAIKRAQATHFDGDKMINKENEELDDIIPKKNCKMSPAQQQKAIMEGHNLEELPCFEDDEELDSMSIESNEEDEEGNKKVIVEFDVKQMFRTQPAVKRNQGQQENRSFMTGVTSAVVLQSVHSGRSRASESTDAESASSSRKTGVEGQNGW